MKTSFTPGPWSYGGLIGKSPGAIVANGGGVQVATSKVVPLMYGQQITSEEANANALLISAAPDLLQLLKEAQRLGLTFSKGNAYIRTAYIEAQDELNSRIDAAVAKATGAA